MDHRIRADEAILAFKIYPIRKRALRLTVAGARMGF